MFDFFRGIIQNILLFALHISNPGSFPKPLNEAQEKEYLKKAAAGDVQARNRLIEHNLRLVSHIVKKYYSVASDPDDLVSVGTIGLIKGIDSYNTSKGVRLATYAARCIENEILMYFRSQKKTEKEISINEPIDTDSEGNPLTFMDIMYEEDTIADDIDTGIKARQLYSYVEALEDPREREIITLRYGLYGQKELTQREIAARFGISRSYVSRIEKRVIESLRKCFEN